MAQKFRVRFSSSGLGIYFILSAVGFFLILFAIWQVSLKLENMSRLQSEVNIIMNGITGNILGVVELEAGSNLPSGQALIQDYLLYTFENERGPANFHILKVQISYLTPLRALVAEWDSGIEVSEQCRDRQIEYFQPGRSEYPYLISLDIDTCLENRGSIMARLASGPVLVSIAIIIIWGACIFAMLRSVGKSRKLLSQTEDTDELMADTALIRWTDVRLLTEKALVVRGRNLQFYQTLVLDAQHDAAKILDSIYRTHIQDNELRQNISIIRSILQRLVSEVRSAETPSDEISSHRQLAPPELLKLVSHSFAGYKVQFDLPPNCVVMVSDVFVFERILVNLAANGRKHGRGQPTVCVQLVSEELLQLKVISNTSLWNWLKIWVAEKTFRIELENEDAPVYKKYFGRIGRGLSIVKRGVIKLGGKMFFGVRHRHVESGFFLPVQREVVSNALQDIATQKFTRKRHLFFKDPALLAEAKRAGLSEFVLEQEEFEALLNLEHPGSQKYEIVTDIDPDHPPQHVLIRIINKSERIQGIANNWLGLEHAETQEVSP